MDKVRVGVAGFGNMGAMHAAAVAELPNAQLAAVCEGDAARRERAGGQFGVPTFAGYDQMLASGLIDAVVIATPHPFHADQTIAALDAGIHVLCEKPVAVSTNQARRMNQAAARHPELKFGIDFQSRTYGINQKLKELLTGGELGAVSRITWIATDWFRTWAYYASGGWRATWAQEGGGVLINQCPHNLDMMQWLFGLPRLITAVAFVAKAHPIEVEDEVSAILEYPDGAVGHFITTTAEAAGTSRLEVAGDRGKIVMENNRLSFTRTRRSTRELLEKAEAWPNVETWTIDVPFKPSPPMGHEVILRNFADAILTGAELYAPGAEGVRSVELGNAMLMAGLTRTPVTLPLDGDAYERFLKDLEKQYGGRKHIESANQAVGEFRLGR